MVLD
jgi:hypothetical protein